ncbi:MAG: glycerol-3-phosphate acyltransferase, partial [Planctomycetes bacterium]|nr:glycerol-3-phosphate acyltransferase [Planctomycetota bacterium]
MNPLHPALAGLLGYLLGSISFALLLAKQRGVDLRGFGSGNLGATNATRALGRGRGLLVYFLDALKGGGPTWFVLHMGAEGTLAWEAATCAAAGAWLGHVFPLYHGFKGGKGVATLSGGFLVLDPVAV